MRPLTPEEQNHRQKLMEKINSLQQAGVCPTCKHFETSDVFPPIEDQIFYENDLVLCFLETFPRNPGHSIILVKPHLEDISHMPLNTGVDIFTVIGTTIIALKKVIPAEKIYLCTMCDGKRNHLHFQLIPRLAGDVITGSQLFVKERGIIINYHKVIDRLKIEVSHSIGSFK